MIKQLQHQVKMEFGIGRYLNQDEDIHHLNFNKIDNRPENIVILTKSEHSKLHAKLKPISKRGVINE